MKLSNIIPYRVVKIRANICPDEAINLLKPHVDSSFSFLDNNRTFFKGYVNGYNFDIHRRFSGRNSFMPVIQGVVRDHTQGCEIKITIRLSFELLILVGGVTYMDIIALSQGAWYFPILTTLVSAFVYLIAWQVYDGEAIQAVNFLKNVWRDKTEDNGINKV